MPRLCSVCAHAERASIDEALIGYGTFHSIATRFALSEPALKRHKKEHLPTVLALAQAAAEVANGDDLLTQLRQLQVRTLSLLDQAETAGRLGTALMAVGQARANIELLAKLIGQLDERSTINLTLSGEWVTIRGVILDALQPYAAARVTVADKLAVLEAGHAGR